MKAAPWVTYAAFYDEKEYSNVWFGAIAELADAYTCSKNVIQEVSLGALKTREWKRRDWKTRHRTAGVENARLENAAPYCRGGKYETGKRGTKTAGVENTRLENTGTSFLWKAKRVF